MNGVNINRKKKLIIIIASVAIVIALVFFACAIYLGDYYRADNEAISAFAPMNAIDIKEEDGYQVFIPSEINAGFIFYPGGKVEYTAYQPLMAACAEQGILSVLVEMPFNLAVFDINAADGIQEKYPEVDKWYIGGHSLGGSMAASYVSSHADDFSGLILLASYSTADLSETDLSVLSVYGSEDGVMNREKYESARENLPEGFKELMIDGANHAGFGMYGAQDGDGEASITAEEQIYVTANTVSELIFR